MALPAGWSEPAALGALAAAAPVPAFAPSAGAKIATKEEDAAGEAAAGYEDGAGDAVKAALARIRELLAAAPTAAGAAAGARSLLAELGARLRPTAFEKDDDSNGHVDFLTSATNLRRCEGRWGCGGAGC